MPSTNQGFDRRSFLATGILSIAGGAPLVGNATADTNTAQQSPTTVGNQSTTTDVWSQFQHGPGNTNAAMGATPPTQQFTPAWAFEAASGYPVLDNESVYFVSNSEDTTTLFALDRTTGTKRWSVEIDDPTTIYTEPPAVINETVYLSGSRTHAFDATTGAEQWVVDDSGSGMKVTEERLYFMSGKQMIALDRTDGSRIWQRGIGGSSAYHAIAGQTLYVGIGTSGNAAFVLALDATTGKRHWKTKIDHISPRIVATDEHVFAATTTALYGLAADTGDIRWTKAAGLLQRGQARNVHSPAVGNGNVYAAIGDSMYALNPVSGNTQWKTSIGDYGGGPLVACADGVVYSYYASELLVLNAASGDFITTYQGPPESSALDFRVLVPTDERLYLADYTTLYAIAGGRSGATSRGRRRNRY